MEKAFCGKVFVPHEIKTRHDFIENYVASFKVLDCKDQFISLFMNLALWGCSGVLEERPAKQFIQDVLRMMVVGNAIPVGAVRAFLHCNLLFEKFPQEFGPNKVSMAKYDGTIPMAHPQDIVNNTLRMLGMASSKWKN